MNWINDTSAESEIVICLGPYGAPKDNRIPSCGWKGPRSELIDGKYCPTCKAGHTASSIIENKEVMQKFYYNICRLVDKYRASTDTFVEETIERICKAADREKEITTKYAVEGDYVSDNVVENIIERLHAVINSFRTAKEVAERSDMQTAEVLAQAHAAHVRAEARLDRYNGVLKQVIKDWSLSKAIDPNTVKAIEGLTEDVPTCEKCKLPMQFIGKGLYQCDPCTITDLRTLLAAEQRAEKAERERDETKENP